HADTLLPESPRRALACVASTARAEGPRAASFSRGPALSAGVRKAAAWSRRRAAGLGVEGRARRWDRTFCDGAATRCPFAEEDVEAAGRAVISGHHAAHDLPLPQVR